MLWSFFSREELKGAKIRERIAKAKRYVLIGLASIGGGALIGVTGGLAAPLIGAGLGSMIGTTAFGVLGTGFGVAAVASLFGAAGAGLTGTVNWLVLNRNVFRGFCLIYL